VTAASANRIQSGLADPTAECPHVPEGSSHLQQPNSHAIAAKPPEHQMSSYADTLPAPYIAASAEK
jgi:hypothetical protein